MPPRKKKAAQRKTFENLSSRAYEHPADRAAMAALRKIPGFDLLLSKVVSFIGERTLRMTYLGGAIRVSENQLGNVNKIYEECLAILDIKDRPELYVSQTPLVNAGAVGVDRPFIVINSGSTDIFNEDELRFVLGHELGHILSKHVLYKTMLALMMNLSLTQIGIPIAPLAIYGVIAALREWDRRSEMSCDRAGLLCTQDSQVAFRALMKTAGGDHGNHLNIDEFHKQIADYQKAGDAFDSVVKLMNLLGRTHPVPVMRAADLQKWLDSGSYDAILAGDYKTRDMDDQASMMDDISDGASSYRKEYGQSDDPLVKFAHELSGVGFSIFERAKGLFNRDGSDNEASANAPVAALPDNEDDTKEDT